jgi:ribonuclease P/MRP protein subunit POP5
MKLKPSLKQKKRYVTFEIISKKRFSKAEIEKAFNLALKDFFGTWGLAKSSPQIIGNTFDEVKQSIIVKINHKYVDELKSALILIKDISGIKVIVKSIVTSGILKKAKI